MRFMASRPPVVSATVRRPASPGEWSACRMLLPESFRAGATPETWLAIGSGDAIVGAAAVTPREGALHAFRIRVVRPARRRGIGTLLLQRVAGREHSAIYAACAAGELDAEPFLLASGFNCVDRLFDAEGDLSKLRNHLFPLRERLLASGRIPAGIAILRPADVPAARLAQLYAEHLVPFREYHAGYALPLIDNPRLAESSVLCVDGEVAGMVLFECDPQGVVSVHGRLVMPKYRGGWANILLMAAGIDRLPPHARRIRFEAPDSNPDTKKLIRRVDAEVLGCTSCFVRPGSPASGPLVVS
jgi:GNAT superfamily N-acetyltransferase